MPPGVVVRPPPGVSHVLPPSQERWITWPNQPLDCDAYTRFGSAGGTLSRFSSPPPKKGAPPFPVAPVSRCLQKKPPPRVPAPPQPPPLPPSSLPPFFHASAHATLL